jgi:hypothetical protein
MKYKLYWLVLFVNALIGCGAPSEDDFTEPAPVEELGEALSLPLTGVWNKDTGLADSSFVTIEFMGTLVDRTVFPSAPVGAKHFFARVESQNGQPREDISGYYVENSSTVTLGNLGSVTSNAARYICAGPCGTGASYSVAQSGTADGATLLLVRPGYTTNLRKSSSFTVGAGASAAIVMPDNPTRIEEQAAYELQRHIALVQNIPVELYAESKVPAGLGATSIPFYVGNTAFARNVGLRAADLPDEGYLIQTVGNAVVMLGKESGAAVGPSSVTWLPNADALSLMPTSKELRYEVPKNENLFTASGVGAGGTIELWMKDTSTCATNPPCGASDILSLTRVTGGPAGVDMVAYNLQGNSTSFGFTLFDGIDGSVRVPDVAGAYIPRDGAIHHITASFAPCGSQVCISGWVDDRVVWTDVAIAGTRAASLNLGKPYAQTLRLNSPGAPGISASLYGLRVAAKPTTRAEHQARNVASLQTTNATDRLVLDFKERAGFPKNKPVLRRVGPRPLGETELWGQRGTLHAAYEVLDRFFKVRWYMPGSLGLAYTTKPNVTIGAQKTLVTHNLRYRHTGIPRWLTPFFHVNLDSMGESFTLEDRVQWAARMRLGGEDTAYNHALYNFRDNNIAAHPNWFSTVAPNHPCLGRADLSAQITDFARQYAASVSDEAYLASAAGAQMPTVKNGAFSLSPLDANVLPRGSDGVFDPNDCNYQSALGRGLVNPNYPPEQFFSGEASEYVFDFYNRVATQMSSVIPPPGRSPFVTGLAYADYSFPPNQPIHPKLTPMVTFDIMDWGTTNPSAVGRQQLNAWKTKMGSRAYLGWTYLIDATYGMFAPPSFGYRGIANAATEAMGLGLGGLTFEHSHSWDTGTPLDMYNNPALREIIEDFRAFVTPSGYHRLWDEWPTSMSVMFEAGPGHSSVFNCKLASRGEDPRESYEPLYSPYCAKYNNNAPGVPDPFARMDPLLRAATMSRGMPDGLLDTYLMLRTMGQSSQTTSDAINEHFDLAYGTAGAPLRALHEAMAAIPRAYEITSCTRPLSDYQINECKWALRVPRSMMFQLRDNIDQARARLTDGTLTEVQAKRVRAFTRNTWCTMARAYYAYYAEGAGDRASDPMRLRDVCQEDPTLNTFMSLGTRFVIE